MNFGPLVPQEIDGIVVFLEKNHIPFAIHFNREAANQELADNVGNNLGLAEWRTRAYMAQHFYVEVSDEYLINNPKVESMILKYITKHDFEEVVRTEVDNVIPIDEETNMKEKAQRTKFVQKLFALLFLASILYGLIASLTHD